MGAKQEITWINEGLADKRLLASPGSGMTLAYSVYNLFQNIKQYADSMV